MTIEPRRSQVLVETDQEVGSTIVGHILAKGGEVPGRFQVGERVAFSADKVNALEGQRALVSFEDFVRVPKVFARFETLHSLDGFAFGAGAAASVELSGRPETRETKPTRPTASSGSGDTPPPPTPKGSDKNG